MQRRKPPIFDTFNMGDINLDVLVSDQGFWVRVPPQESVEAPEEPKLLLPPREVDLRPIISAAAITAAIIAWREKRID